MIIRPGPTILIGLLLGSLISHTSAQTTLPAFVWSTQSLVGGGSGLQAKYEVVQFADLRNSAFEAESGTQGHVNVFIRGQETRSSLSGESPNSGLLKDSVNKAFSSLYLPNVQQGDSTWFESQSGIQLGQCQSGRKEGSLIELREKLSEGGDMTVEICEDGESSLFILVEQMLKESQTPYTMTYFGQSDDVTQQSIGRAMLQSSNQSSKVLCDDKCQTQARLFETIILLVILLWALWIGMNMLHILDTPSRFETEKKEQSRHQD